MSYQLKLKHLIAGEWVDGAGSFESSPSSGPRHSFPVGTDELVDRAVQAAEKASISYSQTPRADRANFLRVIAEEIEAIGDAITTIGGEETGLPAARLEGERGRTCGQLRMFADVLDKGDYLDCRHDQALPERQPLPRPDLRLMQLPVGPVAVFGASNFPLAFSTAGGDTASALAAGCPVVVKAHQAHPGTSDLVAQAIARAIVRAKMPEGVFSMIHGGSRKVGEALVKHPLISAVGFTGSLVGGRALFDLCAQRPKPIPFFGELGSVNPMFMLPGAVSERGEEIGRGWAASLTMGAGQFCTNPGIIVVIDGEPADKLINAAKDALADAAPQMMLTDGIAAAYQDGQKRLASTSGVRSVLTSMCDQRQATPYLYETDGANWLADESLGHEVFGPLGLIVKVSDFEQMLEVAKHLDGQLTCTLHTSDDDSDYGRALMPILICKAGRVLANAYPTGVEVCDAMVHGGPYPASTNFGATSVGSLAIRRFLRPVCFQDIPENLLPDELR
jgi:alpha-ketoglutaric semialdehyde dehydrogenase